MKKTNLILLITLFYLSNINNGNVIKNISNFFQYIKHRIYNFTKFNLFNNSKKIDLNKENFSHISIEAIKNMTKKEFINFRNNFFYENLEKAFSNRDIILYNFTGKSFINDDLMFKPTEKNYTNKYGSLLIENKEDFVNNYSYIKNKIIKNINFDSINQSIMNSESPKKPELIEITNDIKKELNSNYFLYKLSIFNKESFVIKEFIKKTKEIHDNFLSLNDLNILYYKYSIPTIIKETEREKLINSLSKEERSKYGNIINENNYALIENFLKTLKNS